MSKTDISSEEVEVLKITPFFIVSDVPKTIDFYRKKLGFEVTYQSPEEDPFFAMLSRDRVSIMIKHMSDSIQPQSNRLFADDENNAHDGFWHINDPDTFCRELKSKGVKITRDVEDTSYGTRDFEFEDLNGYVFVCGYA